MHAPRRLFGFVQYSTHLTCSQYPVFTFYLRSDFEVAKAAETRYTEKRKKALCADRARFQAISAERRRATQ
jgi:hypothetical protein